ncbi:MAG TPA: phosphatase PAP2 family protein [Nitrospirota bacterium]|nr:phosphatase PAP2 family protein [Nitrospirota bacterium]
MNLKKFITSIPLAILLIMCCYHFLDEGIALFVKRVLMSGKHSSLFSADIPDFLPFFVFIITALAWVLYFHDKRKGIDDIRRAFSLLVGTSLPMAFLIKSILKFVFGGITTRFWLASPVAREFHWFHGVDYYSGFPSGHMAVFTAIFLDLRKYYPRCRPVCGGLIFLMALALILTNYHFISDLVAGAYLGYVIYYFADRGLTLLHKSRDEIDKG